MSFRAPAAEELSPKLARFPAERQPLPGHEDEDGVAIDQVDPPDGVGAGGIAAGTSLGGRDDRAPGVAGPGALDA